jgi:hypothetical protein
LNTLASVVPYAGMSTFCRTRFIPVNKEHAMSSTTNPPPGTEQADPNRFRLTPEQLDRAAAEARRLLQVQSEFAATAAKPQAAKDPSRFRLTEAEWEMAVQGAKEDLQILGRLQANRPLPQTPDQEVLSRLA